MWESIVVGIIVLAAAFFVMRATYKSATGKSKTCGCGLDSCPLNESGQCDPAKASGRPKQER